MPLIEHPYTYESFETYEDINKALDLIKSFRLYKPGDGLIQRMTRIRWFEYKFTTVILAYANESLDVPIGAAVVDNRVAEPTWSTYDASLPKDYHRINVWVKPNSRKRGVGKNLLLLSGVVNELGVECYDTGRPAKKLYACLEKSRMY